MVSNWRAVGWGGVVLALAALGLVYNLCFPMQSGWRKFSGLCRSEQSALL